MIGIITSAVASFFLLILGLYTGASRKIVGTMIKGVCRVMRIESKKKKEKEIELSEEVMAMLPDVKKVKKSRENAERVSSVSYVGIVVIVVALVGLIVDTALNNVAVSLWISGWLKFVELETIKVYWTSAMFALLTSGVSMCLSQWKKGRDYRNQQRKEKIKGAAKRELTEKELVQILTQKVEAKR